MQDTEENTPFSLKNSSASISERILDYISQSQNTDDLADKIAKNFGAYMRADQSRLIGSDLTPENINNERKRINKYT